MPSQGSGKGCCCLRFIGCEPTDLGLPNHWCAAVIYPSLRYSPTQEQHCKAVVNSHVTDVKLINRNYVECSRETTEHCRPSRAHCHHRWRFGWEVNYQTVGGIVHVVSIYLTVNVVQTASRQSDHHYWFVGTWFRVLANGTYQNPLSQVAILWCVGMYMEQKAVQAC